MLMRYLELFAGGFAIPAAVFLFALLGSAFQ